MNKNMVKLSENIGIIKEDRQQNILDLIDNKNDELALFEAMKVGFLLYPDFLFIWQVYEEQNKQRLTQQQKEYLNQCKQSNDFSPIDILNLSKFYLIEIGEISLCHKITMLNLSDNYLVNIEPLKYCNNLVRLDLQNNQVNF
jgi:Leucine-rich repeat (LRR) protein